METNSADNQGNDFDDFSPDFPELIPDHVSDDMLASDGIVNGGSQYTACVEVESDDAEPMRDDGDRPHSNEGEVSDTAFSPRSIDDHPDDYELPRLSRDEIMAEISEYLNDALIRAVYGDSVSGSRTRRYEPIWPMDFNTFKEPPLIEPAGQEEADSVFHELWGNFRDWYKPTDGPQAAEKTQLLQNQIVAFLSYQQQKRMANPQPETCSGNFLLYRNLPDAATEANVWSLINSAHMAIRRQDFALAERYIVRAFSPASKLRFKPLIGRCWFWKGKIAEGLGDRKSASEAFLEAMHCVGFYQEGEMLAKLVKDYKRDLLEILDEQDDSQGEDEWSLKVRRAILGIGGGFQLLQHLPPRPSGSSAAITFLEYMASNDSYLAVKPSDREYSWQPWLRSIKCFLESPESVSSIPDFPGRSIPSWARWEEQLLEESASRLAECLQSEVPMENVDRTSLSPELQSSSSEQVESARNGSSKDSSTRDDDLMTFSPEIQPSPREVVLCPQEVSPKDKPPEKCRSGTSSLDQPSSSKEYVDNLVNKLMRGESDWDSDIQAQPRDINWLLADELESKAQDSLFVHKETLYELCKGLSPSFEDSILAEGFQEDFDNYPEIEGSIAWRVLDYIRTKATLSRPSGSDSLSQISGMGTADDLTEADTARVPRNIKETNGAAPDNPLNEPSDVVEQRPTLMIETGRPNVPPIPYETRSDVIRQARRVDITADEKIVAYEQYLLTRQSHGPPKSSQRLELENNPEWQSAIKQQVVDFEQLVQDEMERSKVSQLNARVRVKYKNKEILKSRWGPEGVRTPTPSPTRRAREQDREERDKETLEFFRAELTCLTYRRKFRSYRKLPLERQLRIAAPVEPTSTIAWLDDYRKRSRELIDDYNKKSKIVLAEHNERKRVMVKDRKDRRRLMLKERAAKAKSRLDKILRDNAIVAETMATEQLHADGTDLAIDHDGTHVEEQRSTNLTPPLLAHPRPSQISHIKSLVLEPRDDSNGTSNATIGTVPSDASSNTYEALDKRISRRITRALGAQVAMDAMSDAMEQARLMDEAFSTEQLVDIAEIAISEAASASGSEDAFGSGSDDSGYEEAFGNKGNDPEFIRYSDEYPENDNLDEEVAESQDNDSAKLERDNSGYKDIVRDELDGNDLMEFSDDHPEDETIDEGVAESPADDAALAPMPHSIRGRGESHSSVRFQHIPRESVEDGGGAEDDWADDDDDVAEPLDRDSPPRGRSLTRREHVPQAMNTARAEEAIQAIHHTSAAVGLGTQRTGEQQPPQLLGSVGPSDDHTNNVMDATANEQQADDEWSEEGDEKKKKKKKKTQSKKKTGNKPKKEKKERQKKKKRKEEEDENENEYETDEEREMDKEQQGAE